MAFYRTIYISVVCGLICFTCVSCGFTDMYSTAGKGSESSKLSQSVEQDAAFEPCWFLRSSGFDSVDAETIKERQDRETFGYPQDTSLREAVEMFNIEQKCWPSSASLPPLTEEEVIAAVSTTPDHGASDAVWPMQKDTLLAIRRDRRLPIGTLLTGVVNTPIFSPPLEQESIVVEGGRIYLFLGLNDNPRFEKQKPEHVFLIRKYFVGLKTVE